jgi:Ser/Thr protein kinase RdoA (MazF antagonist)
VVELARVDLAHPGERLGLRAHEPLKKSVWRLRFGCGESDASVVAKRQSAHRARATQLVAERWLPAAGLGSACARVLGARAERGGRVVWVLYEDVDGSALDNAVADPARVAPVIDLIADLHARFSGHALLAECRRHGEELGMGFFIREVGRCLRHLEAVPSARVADEHARVADRLLGRVEALWRERHERALVLQAHGGPDTLLHGDLWTANTLLVERDGALGATLIDWDHVGVGPASYDISTFLYRFGPDDRPWILERYREAAAGHGRELPDDATLNALFETAEYARYACCLAETAAVAARGEPWALEMMAEIERWFASLTPVLALDGA